MPDLISKKVQLFDGAMGTLLYSRGIFINRNFDELNVSRPDMVEKVHADYLSAGAMVLTTNTFGANPVRLAGHGLAQRMDEINRAGVRIAREVAGGQALVAGSIGPSGLIPDLSDEAMIARLTQAFSSQATVLADAGADLLVVRLPDQAALLRPERVQGEDEVLKCQHDWANYST